MITKVEAHTGSTKNHTYKLVTGTLVGFSRREITGGHYVVDAEILGDDGVRYTTGQARIVRKWTETPAVPSTQFQVSPRFNQVAYRMRGVYGGYKGDLVKHWERRINGKIIEFAQILWNGGQDGRTVRVYDGRSGRMLHEYNG